MTTIGQIGKYRWGEFWQEEPELFLPDVVRALRSFLVGTFAVNASFDSGRLGGARAPLPLHWSQLNGYGVSPSLEDSALDHWPRSHSGFDEWYFFREVPANLQVQAFCNWFTFSLSEWQSLQELENGFDLSAQLARLRPQVVVGEGRSIFVLSPMVEVINAFLSLAHEP